MQFTVLADKLPGLSVDEFKHEFRKVHAEETKDAASSLGLITEYIQGLYLPSAIEGATQLTRLPLSEHDGPYQSLAQLTWPSVTVLHGSLQSAGYKASAAAKHEFAAPKHLFLTERLEPDQYQDENGLRRLEDRSGNQRPVVLIAALTPDPDLDEAGFRELWAKHAECMRAIAMAYYQRNAVIPVPREQIRAMFAGTQFPAERCWGTGGYEEFVFASTEDAQSFCNQHGESLRISYGRFCDNQRSWCAGFDYIEHWGRGDIGFKQRFVGTVLGTVLHATTSFRLYN